MQIDHLDDIVHFLILRHLHSAEDLRDHLGADVIMIAEGPTGLIIPGLGTGFADIVEQSRPAQPEII